MRVYIGFDRREPLAHTVAKRTAEQFGCQVTTIYQDRLRASGMLTRPVDERGSMYDLNSSAPQSTDFAISRFFTPLLAHSGWCLFTDCDVVFLHNPAKLMDYADDKYAVMVVKHQQNGGAASKMDGQTQTSYRRKNWSSVALFNCDHPANKRLTLNALNQWPGRDLHAFAWLADSEIGELPREWNWLVGIQPAPDDPCIAHFTLGGPFLQGWKGAEHDAIWLKALDFKA